MSKPIKVTNQRALEDWDNYVNDFRNMPNRQAALLPLDINIESGRITRKLILASAVKRLYAKHKKYIPEYMRSYSEMTPTMTEFPNIDKVVDHYVNNINDGSHSGGGLTPLDIETNRPTYMLFRINRSDVKSPPSKFLQWRFSENKQITCHNDGLGPFLNLLPICTLDNDKILLAYNRHRSNHPALKFDLHVTLHQKVRIGRSRNWVDAKTPIIIDPGLGNSGGFVP